MLVMSLMLEAGKTESQKRLKIFKTELNSTYPRSIPYNKSICIYVCGSLGRLEMTETTDLDLFFVTMDEKKQQYNANLDKYLFFAELYRINNNLGYDKPSKKGMFWDFISKKNLLDIGSREEDFNNSFTARMLLILESKPVYNKSAYNRLIKETVDKYFIDYSDYSDEFYPLFLINDIERYWRTVALNYEHRRDVNDDVNKKYWTRLKLKYARLVTCYSMIACLFKKDITPEYVIDCINMTPFERIYMLSDQFSNVDSELKSIVEKITKEYEWFLALRKEHLDWWNCDSNKASALEHANRFHEIVIREFMNRISLTNLTLRNKLELY